ncbi:hypothetical protein [Niallia sp. Krafla_26]|uniref:hypothetical protein n=1 Tax=Niallia sp. Krafla_26 TaxID=3064703 RepID=UPI003D18023E
MKKYSEANLLKDELDFIPANSDVFSKFLYKLNKKTMVYLKINLPVSLYLRAEIFCEDIEELSEMEFTQTDLINILYNDFLLYAKKNPDPHKIYDLLLSLDQDKKQLKLVQESESVFTTLRKSEYQNMQPLQIKMRRKEALRGEVLLADIEEVVPDHGYTLEKLFELLYCDFVEKFRKENSKNVIENVLKSLIDDL